MPLTKDPLGGGTNGDGSRSQKFCSHCYRQGAFTVPDMTVEGMTELVRGRIKEMGFPGFLAGFFVRGIPKLERWKKPQ